MVTTLETRPAVTSQTGGLRAWLEQIDKLGQLRRIHGANTEEEIGAATDVLQHAAESPAAIFDQIPGYAPDLRVLVNSFGATDRIALTLGLPLGLSKVQVSDAWRKKIFDQIPGYAPDLRVLVNSFGATDRIAL